MDRHIRIERAIRGARTASGQPTITWALQGTLWAEITENTGQEAFRSNQVVAQAEIRFRVRYPALMDPLPSPSEDTRIVYEGRAYNIVANPEIGRRAGLYLYATARSEATA